MLELIVSAHVLLQVPTMVTLDQLIVDPEAYEERRVVVYGYLDGGHTEIMGTSIENARIYQNHIAFENELFTESLEIQIGDDFAQASLNCDQSYIIIHATFMPSPYHIEKQGHDLSFLHEVTSMRRTVSPRNEGLPEDCRRPND